MNAAEPLDAARSAGLRYVTDDRPGIRRVKGRSGFRYIAPDGKPLTDDAEIARIRSLAIPPAYSDVWIAPQRNAHLQATGRDARGRKQYRYHKKWREVRDESKFDRMIAFAKALPKIRAAVKHDLEKPGMPREKILATVVTLLEATMIRVGNEEYARDNDSYGLTTMHNKHVAVRGETIKFTFRGKSGIKHSITVADKRLAKVVRAARDLPGYELFEYLNEHGEPASIDSSDVNAYIKEIAEDDFTAKDFRTWEATMSCALALAAARVGSQTEAKAAVLEAVKSVALRLGNTPAVCKKSYIFPPVIDEFVSNGGLTLVEKRAVKKLATTHGGLAKHEREVVGFIERIVTRDEHAHLSDLLAKSVRATTRGKAAKRTSRRGRPARES